MNFLRFALNTTVKMANVIAKRERRAFELNERGIMLANSNRYDEALECFLEAKQLIPDNQIIQHNINQCMSINNHETSISSVDSFDYDDYGDYEEFICDLDDMRDRVDNEEFPDDHPIYLLDIWSIDWTIGFEELEEADTDLDDITSRHTYYGFDEDQFLVIVNAYERDIGEQPWTGDDIEEYLEDTYGLESE